MMNHPPRAEGSTERPFAAGPGEMEARVQKFDWAATALGPPPSWPQSLHTALRIMLGSRFPMALWWGPDRVSFYNDAYVPVLGARHPAALGALAPDIWSDIWDAVGPQAEAVFNGSGATWNEELLLTMERHGFREETYFTFSYSPVPADDGQVGGLLIVCSEDTQRVVSRRRLRTLRVLSEQTIEARSAEQACTLAAAALADNPHDVPLAFLYLLNAGGASARLAGAVGVPDEVARGIAEVPVHDPGPWPLHAVVATQGPVDIQRLPAGLSALRGSVWEEPTRHAIILPLTKSGPQEVVGMLVAGVSPRLSLSDDYRHFLALLAERVSAAITTARGFEEERRRVEALRQLDEAKTQFFSNVSHEFRTPLTLMLGPLEDLLARRDGALPVEAREMLEMTNRNGLRLLRLVNALLDFSRIEAGRVRARYVRTDLAAFTADVASGFRAACDAAGLRLTIDCTPLPGVVYVDREMWEKIVLNLLSNAFKFTLAGEISVLLRPVGGAAELMVRDTGTGIPADEMPRLFERFHRVENARGRTHEGSGIGLALVQELVRLHGGTIDAQSIVDQGTTFRVSIPLGQEHLPVEQVGAEEGAGPVASAAPLFVEEALRWLPDDATPAGGGGEREVPLPGSAPPGTRPRVLVADDNADMRQYVTRILSAAFQVTAVEDGEAALRSAIDSPPDLVLSDVMMPRLDGFGLLRALRAHASTQRVPVIMLSARAGEESRLEGMEAGSDDYLVKPFSARELLSRVSAHIRLARVRHEAEQSVLVSEARLQMALEAARMVVWHWDPVADAITVSNNLAALYGLPPGTTLAEATEGFRLVHPEDVEAHRGRVQRAVEHGEHYVSQFRIIRPVDGQVIWLEEHASAAREQHGKVVQLTGVTMDITARRAAEEELRRRAEEVQTLLDTLPVGIVVAHDPDGRMITGNRAAAELLRSPADRNLSLSAPATEAPTHFRVQRDGLELAPEDLPVQRAARGEHVRNEELELVFQDGGVIHELISAAPLYDANNQVRGAVAGILDVTARRRLEDELRDVAARLSEADRRKDEFLATLAHELRNPLAPLSNGLHLLRLAGNNPGALASARDMMERQVHHMIRLIDDLMDLTRITRGQVTLKRTRLPLVDAVRQAVESTRPLYESVGHSLVIDMPDDPLIVDADETRLAQVFVNLLNNAAKFSPAGSTVRVQVRSLAGSASIVIADEGVGIPAEMLDRVFDMFIQVDPSLERSQSGLGIGLSIVRRLVEMHGGTVEARSEGAGRGTQVEVRIPIAGPQAETATAGNVQLGRPASRRVLVVDDNTDAAWSLATLLDVRGHEVTVAHDGIEAERVAASFRPEVILMDIGMPRRNGYDAAREIRRQQWGREIMLVACTGWGQAEDRRKSEDAGFDHHLVKPVDVHALEALLATRPAQHPAHQGGQ